jgi:hypothetical protein
MPSASPISPSLHKLLPQLSQNTVVTFLPESAVAEYFLGVPEVKEKEEVGTIMFVEKAEPEILRQSVQWQIACDGEVSEVVVGGVGGEVREER